MQVSGNVMRSRYMFVRKQGEDVFGRVAAALGGELRDIFVKGPLETVWYPYDWLVELHATIDRSMGTGDFAICENMGSFSCEQNLTGIYRVFFRFGNLDFLLDRAGKAWHSQYDFGSMKVERDGQGHVRMQLSDAPRVDRGLYLAVKGWGIKAAELSGSEIITFTDKWDPTPGSTSAWEFDYL